MTATPDPDGRRKDRPPRKDRLDAYDRSVLLQLVIDNLPESIVAVDRDDRFFLANQAFADLVSQPSPDAVLGKTHDDLYPDDPERARLYHEVDRRIMQKGERRIGVPGAFEIPGTREVRWLSTTQVPIHNKQGDIVGLVGLARDITQRKIDEDALRESERRYRAIVENINEGLLIFDLKGRLLDANRHVLRWLGRSREDLIGQCLRSLGQPAFVEDMLGALGDRDEARVRTALQPADGPPIDLNASVRIVSREQEGVAQAILMDVSAQLRAERERRALEAQVEHARRLEMLGILAGGIAHDFNNLLVGITGYAELALMNLPPNHNTRDMIERIKKAANRAADLNRQLLAFSGKLHYEMRITDLNELIGQALDRIQPALPGRAVVRFDPHEDPLRILADPSQIEQALLQILVNAVEAMDAREGPVCLRTAIERLSKQDRPPAPTDLPVDEGLYALLEVTDEGAGMSPETIERLFDPFFSTKMTGRGLGLAAVLGIVRGHHGTIRVRSEPGRGSTFRLYFPMSEPSESEPARR